MTDASANSALEKRIKKHVIGKPHHFMAVAPLGFEETLVKELEYIGVVCVAGIKVAGDGKVEFTAKITEAWKAVAYSRIANRILMEVANFKAENFGQLEKGVAAIPWELFLKSAKGLNLHTTCKHSRLYHSDAVEERVRKCIEGFAWPNSSECNCERQQLQCHYECYETESSCNLQNLYVNLQDDRCTLWLDLAGVELYKRGHERFVAEAPLKETIAAAMIFETSQMLGSAKHITIHDGMAGSGTFSLEAAYIANGLIPGKCRDFALKHQPAFKEGTWKFILKDSNVIASDAKQSKQNGPAVKIITSDISERPIDIIKHNVEVSPLAGIAKSNPDATIINPQLKDFFSYTVADFASPANEPQNIILLLNPPYGKRLAFDAPKLYTKIGQKLTELAGGSAHACNITVAILAPKDCTQNLLQACPELDPKKNKSAQIIETSHGGFSLNAIFSKICAEQNCN